jgi:hypothetical protein
MPLQSCGSLNRDNFETPPWESWNKSHSDVGAMERCKKYYMGKGGGFPQVRAMVNLVSPESPVACLNTKGVIKSDLTKLLVGLM